MNILEATDRISKITKQKYGCQMEFLYFRNYETNEKTKFLFEVIVRNLGAQFIISNDCILVPIYVDNELFGTVVANNTDKMDPSLYEEMNIFLDTTLRDFIVQKEKLRRLRIEEAALRVSTDANVIPIFKNLPNRSFFSNENQIDFVQGPQKPAMFLTGGRRTERREAALDLHSFFNRNSFIPYSALELEPGNIKENLSSLGRVTIFIPEVLELAPRELTQIFDYIKETPIAEGVFFVISSEKHPREIEAENLMDTPYLEFLKQYHLEFQKPSVAREMQRRFLWQTENIGNPVQ